MPSPATEQPDLENVSPDRLPPQRQPSTVPSFLFISFVLWMIMHNQADDPVVKNQWLDALAHMRSNIQDFSLWLNGTASNFTLPSLDPTLMPLVNDFVTFGHQLDPASGSYYANLTGFWRGDIIFHNLTNETAEPHDTVPFWLQDAHNFVSSSNQTNVTEQLARLGKWRWAQSSKVAISFGDKLMWANDSKSGHLSRDIAMIHGKIDLSDPDTSEEMRLELEGMHFISNGSLYGFAETNEQGMDLRFLPALVPELRLNDTARLVEAELLARETKIKDKVESGNVEDSSAVEESPKSSCSFKFFGQLQPSNVPQFLLQELEDEIDKPTGISTVRPPEMTLQGVLVSKNCGIVYELPAVRGLKSQALFRKITAYGGLSGFVNMILLILLLRQVGRSRSAAGLSRVSRYPFIVQSLIDAVSFVGHVTIAILAEGRTSVAVLAPAGLACILFVYEAQFAVLIGQIQAPEDVRPTPSPAQPQPQSQPAAPPQSPAITATPAAASEQSGGNTILPTIITTPPAPSTAPPRPSMARFLYDHIRNDPSARMWTIMSFFLLIVFRLVIALSIPLVFVGSLYTSMWTAQIYRAVRRGRTSGLTAEYVVGTTICRLYYILYFLACPHNILDVEQRQWVYIVALIMFGQVAFLLLQNYFGPAFFLPRGIGSVEVYNYHPSLPLPDPEAPEQSMGDCSICMDAIQVDPALRQGTDEKGDGNGFARHTTSLWAQSARKSYSLAPCHHLFHTACLERWLAIKNICPQCRRPLPPL